MAVGVYFLRSTDTNINAITFKYENGHTVYYYDTKDDSGGMSSLVPHITYNGQLNWEGNYGNIVKLKNFDSGDWSDSKYIFSISNKDVNDYDIWVQSWVKEDKQYSIFENTNEFTGKTTEDFIKDSLSFFAMRGVEKLYITPPEIKMYKLKWSSKLGINGNINTSLSYIDMFRWYQTLSHGKLVSLEEVISCINSTHSMYYHEYINGEHKYWLLNDAEIITIYKKIIVDFNKSQSKTQTNLQSNYQRALTCPNTFAVLTTTNTTSSNSSVSSGLILVVVLIAILIIMIIVSLIIIKVSGEETLIGVSEPIGTPPVVTSPVVTSPIHV
jgi:hypothetical protein